MTQLLKVKTLQNSDTLELMKYSGDWFPLTHCLRRFKFVYRTTKDLELTSHLVEVQNFCSEREALEEWDRRS